MRRIAAHYLIDRGRITPRPLVECDDEGCIVRIGQWERLDNIPQAEFYAGALTAGFVNAHCHLELSYLRGAIERGTGFGGFARAIGQVRGNYTIEERQRALTAASQRMWAEGVQAVADIINDDSSLEHKRQSPIRYHNFAELFGLRADVAAMNNLLTAPNTTLTPHSTYSLQSKAFAAAAEGEMLSIHFMESPDEEELYRGEGSLAAWYGRMGWECDFLHYGSPAERLVGQVASDKKLLLVYCCCLKEDDLAKILIHFVVPPTFVLCPQSNRYISGLQPPAKMLMECGARVAIGTDSLASNSSLSIIEELKLLTEIPLATRLEWATMGGAEALGISAEMGSVEVGKRPGLVIVEGIEEQDGELQLSPTAHSRRLV
ncbi:MAG: amidohydrolase family protein [Alistipes sp.]|nr:amidohydrolase family protein [Alistipes sp.]